MPFELKITGADMASFYGEAMNAFLVLSKAQALFTPNGPPADNAPAGPVSEPVGDVTKIDPPIVPPPTPSAAEKKARKSKAETPPPVDKVAERDGIPDFLDKRPKSAEPEDPLGLGTTPPVEPPKALTLDDMRDRVKAIVAEHAKRGNEMPVCIAYVRKLFEPFGIKLAAELKPEQFAEFWSASAKYLDGSAK